MRVCERERERAVVRNDKKTIVKNIHDRRCTTTCAACDLHNIIYARYRLGILYTSHKRVMYLGQ